MAAGQRYWLHIDFDNLSAAELTLLRTALEPDPDYCHRLGLGKPVGLGSLQLRIRGILCIDRKRRYGTEALAETGRFHAAYLPDAKDTADWPAPYAADLQARPKAARRELADLPGIDKDDLIDAATLAKVAILGRRDSLVPGTWVHHPLIASQLPEHATPRAAALRRHQVRYLQIKVSTVRKRRHTELQAKLLLTAEQGQKLCSLLPNRLVNDWNLDYHLSPP